MMHAAIYYRVSTDRQDLQSQKTAVEQWLAGLDSSRQPQRLFHYQDEGISGSNSQRPAYQTMLKDAHDGKFDTIIVYRLDRFSRNATEAIKTLLTLDEAGVAFISVTQPVLNLGHENPFRRTMLAAFAEIAEIERQTIVSRVRAGLEAAKARGVKLGAPSKTTVQTKQLILQRRQQGASLRSLAKEFSLSYGAIQKIVSQATTQDSES